MSEEQKLMPVVVQDVKNNNVLMLAYVNEESLEKTKQTGYMHYWSRSRDALWKKGETSGNVLTVREVRTDCDSDCLLVIADPAGPTCHTNARTCFGEATPTVAGIAAALDAVIEERDAFRPAGSYTTRLLESGLSATLAKVEEEAHELAAAARNELETRVVEEAADLVFHVAVLLRQRGVHLTDVLEALKTRRQEP